MPPDILATIWQVNADWNAPFAVSVYSRDAERMVKLNPISYAASEQEAWNRLRELKQEAVHRAMKDRDATDANYAAWLRTSSSDCAAPRCAEPGNIS